MVMQFYTRLMKAVKDCNYGNDEGNQLRDQILTQSKSTFIGSYLKRGRTWPCRRFLKWPELVRRWRERWRQWKWHWTKVQEWRKSSLWENKVFSGKDPKKKPHAQSQGWKTLENRSQNHKSIHSVESAFFVTRRAIWDEIQVAHLEERSAGVEAKTIVLYAESWSNRGVIRLMNKMKIMILNMASRSQCASCLR